MAKKKAAVTTWKPWDDFKEEPERLPIEAPPCPECRYWNPVRIYMGAQYEGVRLCHCRSHSLEMESDFSCFREKWTG